MVKMRAVRHLIEQCNREGVKYFFGMQGGGISPLFNELLDYPDIKTILARHEQGASMEATGYAMVTGKAQMCGGTIGPGAVNLISGLHVGYQNSIPVLAIVSNLSTLRWGKTGMQDATGWGPRTISHVAMASSVTKWAKTIFRPELVPDAVKRAFRIMYSGRQGPVLLDICFDSWLPEVEAEVLPPERYRPVCKVSGDPEKIQEAAELLVNAQSPAILAGGGVKISGAEPELLELSKMLGIPVATTLMGKSCFPEDHPLSLGVTGFYGHDTAKITLRKGKTKNDILLAVGTIFHEIATYSWDKEFGGEKIIHVDIDPTEIGKNYQVEVGIVGDAKLVLRELVDCTKSLINKMEPKKLKELEERKKQRVDEVLKLKGETKYYAEPESFSNAHPMKPQRALKELREFLKKDAIILTDAGNNLTWTERYVQTYFPKTFFVDGGHTSMGASLPLTIGAKLGAPERQVVDCIGNGGFHMLCHEVVTASTYTIPAVWFILNDGMLGCIAHYCCKFGYGGLWEPERYASVDVYDMDFVKFAEACHCYGERVEKPEQIKGAMKNAFDSGKPAIIDVVIDENEIHKGAIERFKSTTEKHPHLLTAKIRRETFPKKII
jgi:acetolactate synthase-1/2/3 large subunit